VALPPRNERARRAARTLSANGVAGLECGTKGPFRAASRLTRSGARGLSARACRPAAAVARAAHASHRHLSRLRCAHRPGWSPQPPPRVRAACVRALSPWHRTSRAGSFLLRQRSRWASGRWPDGCSGVADRVWSVSCGMRRASGASSRLAAGGFRCDSGKRRRSCDPGPCSHGPTRRGAATTHSSMPRSWGSGNMQPCGPGCVWSYPCERPEALHVGPVRLRPAFSEDRHITGGAWRAAMLNFSRMPESIRSRRSGLHSWSRGRA